MFSRTNPSATTTSGARPRAWASFTHWVICSMLTFCSGNEDDLDAGRHAGVQRDPGLRE
jgi:hypothetical protein